MGRPTNRLTQREVTTLKDPGRHADGGGLYLHVDKPSADGRTGAKRWVFVFQWRKKRKEMGLGPVALTSLAEAREAVLEARKLVAKGINPIEARRSPDDAPTFGAEADALLASLAKSFRNKKHENQWKRALTELAAPLRAIPVDKVSTTDVLAVLTPIWNTTPETASRLRGRIERVLDAAKAKGHRQGENPARWRGHLSSLLIKRKASEKGHHAAMPFADLPAFMAKLRNRPAVAARALEFTILTAARTGEALGATLREFDLEAGVWTVGAERMKAGRVHRVALSGRALEIVKDLVAEVRALTDQDPPPDTLIFPGASLRRPLSNMAMDMLLRRMGIEDATVHGFRSSFRDWAGETTNFPRDVAEAALAHKVGDETELAYRRGDALAKRRKLMEAWAGYLARPAGAAVTPFTRPGGRA